MADLAPCPFCGGDAEMDTRQGYTNYFNGRPETGIAIYCRACGVQQMICRGDVPDVEPEHVIELWNRRALLPGKADREAVARLVEAAKEMDRWALVILSAVNYSDKPHVEAVGKAIRGLRAALPPAPSEGEAS